MKKLLTILFLLIALSGFSQMQITKAVTFKGTDWQGVSISLGRTAIDFRQSTISIPVMFFKDMQSLAGGDENAIGSGYLNHTFAGLYPDCSAVEVAIKQYLAEYFGIEVTDIQTIQFCE